MFDKQIDQILDKVDELLQHLRNMQPDLKVVSFSSSSSSNIPTD